MLTCYILTEYLKLQLLLILFLISIIIKCNCTDTEHFFEINKEEDNKSCPFIETLSFGSDIEIQCNDTYLIFNEINEDGKFNWKFANQSLSCQQKGQQQGFINQCNITRINSKYLKVPLKSLTHNEHACVYCPINYKPISSIIFVSEEEDSESIFYKFNITAYGLASDESFEILWAKRVSDRLRNSFNYWFSHRCVDFSVKMIDDNDHSIVFVTDDINISRVEFIIRRCKGVSIKCRTYRTCTDRDYSDISLVDFQIPDSIEKISCNEDCLSGIISTTTTTTTTTVTMTDNIIRENHLSSTIEFPDKKFTTKFLISFLLMGLLIVLLVLLLTYYIISRIRGIRADNVYTKTSHINIDENRENGV